LRCRPGINAAIAEAGTPYGEAYTAVFFTDGKHMTRHTKLFRRAAMNQVMPTIVSSHDAMSHQYAPLPARQQTKVFYYTFSRCVPGA
jgi:hypothetical protein